MAYLKKKVVEKIEEVFQTLENDVTLTLFVGETDCRFCKESREMLTELTDISPRLTLEVFDINKDKDQAEQYGVDKTPAIVVRDQTDYGIKFYGVPGGYEFSSLMEAIKLVSTGNDQLSPQTKEFLDNLETDLHLQVFVTPTCPHCPTSVVLAHRMARYSPKVKAEMVEASEFRELAQKYEVMGVPRTIINEKDFIVGGVPEDQLLQKLKETV